MGFSSVLEGRHCSPPFCVFLLVLFVDENGWRNQVSQGRSRQGLGVGSDTVVQDGMHGFAGGRVHGVVVVSA